MQLSIILAALAAVGTFSVQAKTCVPQTTRECRQVDCTIEIVRGPRDPATISQQILGDAKASVEKLQYARQRIAVSDGTRLDSGLLPPDAQHKGVYWAKIRIHRALDWPWPEKADGSDGTDLPGVSDVKTATLRYCKGLKNVCC